MRSKTSIPAALTILLAVAILNAQATKPAPKLPASGDGDNPVNALKKSTRHGEWQSLEIPGETTKLKTWVVYPERPDKAPVVIVIHEIFGMSDWVRAVTDQLAAEGFIAIAPDLISGMGPDGGDTDAFKGNQTGIGQAIQKLANDEKGKRLDVVRNYAMAQPSASDKSACIGFCWGGGTSFLYATQQPKLNAAVVYYGTPPANDALAKITCPILGCYGGSDARVSSTVAPTKATMATLKKDYFPNIYDGAGHGFLRQQNAAGSPNMKAAQSAWTSSIEFLKKNLETK